MPFPFQKALGGALVALGLAAAPAAFAQDTVRVGVIAEMSGPFAEFGKQMQAGIRAYQKMHGDSVAGKRVEVVIKDVGGPNPDAAKRIATELVVREKVNVLAGFGFTPCGPFADYAADPNSVFMTRAL